MGFHDFDFKSKSLEIALECSIKKAPLHESVQSEPQYEIALIWLLNELVFMSFIDTIKPSTCLVNICYPAVAAFPLQARKDAQ